PHNLDVLIVRLGCEAPHRRLIHPFIFANCCSILNGELGLFRKHLITAFPVLRLFHPFFLENYFESR
ncbi:hypothetical protein, partial [Finegoldia magna]|uniref:hypothetical protein n=1 Tax=Finegoldia magna TaxID=1260 RepID=UPI0026ED49AE